MGISMITALQIQGDGIMCQAGGPDPENGKFVGWISVEGDHKGPRPLLNTEPIYESEYEAVKAMQKIVADIRAMDLTPKKA